MMKDYANNDNNIDTIAPIGRLPIQRLTEPDL